jgi:hypothetical protein
MTFISLHYHLIYMNQLLVMLTWFSESYLELVYGIKLTHIRKNYIKLIEEKCCIYL